MRPAGPLPPVLISGKLVAFTANRIEESLRAMEKVWAVIQLLVMLRLEPMLTPFTHRLNWLSAVMMISADLATFPLGVLIVLRNALDTGGALGGLASEVQIQLELERERFPAVVLFPFPIHRLEPQSATEKKPVVKFDDALAP